MSYKAISHKGQSSDIFFTKDNNQPPQTVNQRQNNKSSYDIIELADAPKENVLQHRKKQINPNAMKSSLFSSQPETQQKIRNYKGAQSTIVLGTDDTSGYNVRKDKTSSYEPSKYQSGESAYERKIQQFYGDEARNNLKIKSAFGTLKREDKNPSVNECKNARDRKFQTFNSNNNVGHTGYRKTEPFVSANSSGKTFDESQRGKYNINDPEKEELNNRIYASEAPKEEEEPKETHENNRKKNVCKEGSDVRFAKLDWKDPMNERLFQKGDNEDSTARQRKLNDLYGVNSVNRKTYKGDEFDRKALEYQIQKDHPLENEAQIMKRVQNVSSLEGSGYTSQPSITKDRQSKNYEIKNFTNIDQVNIKDIEKLMRNKGMHIYGVKTQDYYMDSNQKGRVLFCIRENSDETTFNLKWDMLIISIRTNK